LDVGPLRTGSIRDRNFLFALATSLNKFSMEEIEDIVSKHRREPRTKEPGITVLKREAG